MKLQRKSNFQLQGDLKKFRTYYLDQLYFELTTVNWIDKNETSDSKFSLERSTTCYEMIILVEWVTEMNNNFQGRFSTVV